MVVLLQKNGHYKKSYGFPVRQVFKLNGGSITQVGMLPDQVIEPFHILEQTTLGLHPGPVTLVIDQLGFQGAEKTLGHRVVVAAPFATHALNGLKTS